MNYLIKRYWRILFVFIFSAMLIVLNLKIVGTGYLPQVIGGGSGPLDWKEIIHLYKSIFIFSLVITLFGIYIDYWDYKKKTK